MKLSIIIPVYNVECFLNQCVESVMSQSYSDWELLLIDDGSLDNSGIICDEYAKKDGRIRVFHRKNSGVSAARNLGINKAKGEWVSFIDADDFIGESYFKGLLHPISEGINVDFIHGGCMNYENGHATTINQQYELFVGTDKVRLFSLFRGLVVSKLFKTDILKANKLLFDEKMKVAEDMAFTMDYLLFVKSYAFVPETSYYYRRDNMGSASHGKMSKSFEEEKYCFTHLFESTQAYINKYSISEEDSYMRLNQRAGQYYATLCSMYYDKSFDKKKRIRTLEEENGSRFFCLLGYVEETQDIFPFVQLLMKGDFSDFDKKQIRLVRMIRIKHFVKKIMRSAI